MLAMIELTYDSNNKIKSFDRETYEHLREELPGLGLTEWKEGDKQPYVYSCTPFLVIC
jgi:hypothetical protein